MSKTKIGLICTGVLAAGVAIFLIYKKSKTQPSALLSVSNINAGIGNQANTLSLNNFMQKINRG